MCQKTVFIRYQHVERIDSEEAQGLLKGTCHIFTKLDGSNMCAYLEDGQVRTQSRNQPIFPGAPFADFVQRSANIQRFLRDFPGLRLYGEWMVPHTIRCYSPEVWNRWFVFDVTAEDPEASYRSVVDGRELSLDVAGRVYIPYDEYRPLLEAYGIDYIPEIAAVEDPTVEELGRMADTQATFMMPEGSGEGIVVKRYDFVNRFGRTEWAKVINSEYSRHRIVRTSERTGSVEEAIAERYVTPDLVNKEYAKIAESGAEERAVPFRLLGTVYHCVITECMWDALKRFGNPTVDFRALRRECETAVKLARPEVFGLRLADAEN